MGVLVNSICYIQSFCFFLRWLKTVLESAGWWSRPSLLSVTHQAIPQPCLQPITCPLIWLTTHTSFRTRTPLITHLSPCLEICHRSFSLSIIFPPQYIVSKVSLLQLASRFVENGYTPRTCEASTLCLLCNKQGRKRWNSRAAPSFLPWLLPQMSPLTWLVTALSCFHPTKSKE